MDDKEKPKVVTLEQVNEKKLSHTANEQCSLMMGIISEFGQRNPPLGILILTGMLGSIVKCLWFMADDKHVAEREVREYFEEALVQAKIEWPSRKKEADMGKHVDTITSRIILPN